MKLEEVLSSLGESATIEEVRPQWEESMGVLPAKRPFFLTPREIDRLSEYCGLPADVRPALDATAERIAADPALLRLAWHGYRRLYWAPQSSFTKWPSLGTSLGENCGVFYLLLALGVVPAMRAFHRSAGIPDSVTRETCVQVRCMSENYAHGSNGRLGIYRRQLGWLRQYTGKFVYVRLGRLEYALHSFGGGAEVYRHRQTGRVMALAEEGQRFDAEGYMPAAAAPDVPAGWTATLRSDADAVTGHPICPGGHALRDRATLPAAEWQRVLAKGDFVLNMHIPAGGGLTPEACEESLKSAAAFFRKHFPETAPAAVVCRSWMFSNLLEHCLPPEANLVRFLRELYLFPTPNSATAALWFIFLQDDFDPATAPRDTSLRRAVLDFLAQGHPWRDGGMFILMDDIPRYGTQQYRHDWPAPR